MNRRAGDGNKLARRKPPTITGDCFLIVVEGKKTEVNYFEALRKFLRLHVVQVAVVHPPATDPVSLVEHAIKLRNERRRQSGYPAFDQVWVVFDLEKQHDERRKKAQDAEALAGREKIQLAVSDPCFEFWLLLHYCYTTVHLKSGDDAKRLLAQHLPGYTEAYDFGPDLFNRTRDAKLRAEQVRAHHDSCSSDRNPITNVDRLIVELNRSVPGPFQLPME
ncbi:hypothetical protein GC173_03840 [bacterium]|nr:hypothetical protein [bacterium]